jgi:hypothetical protein
MQQYTCQIGKILNPYLQKVDTDFYPITNEISMIDLQFYTMTQNNIIHENINNINYIYESCPNSLYELYENKEYDKEMVVFMRLLYIKEYNKVQKIHERFLLFVKQFTLKEIKIKNTHLHSDIPNNKLSISEKKLNRKIVHSWCNITNFVDQIDFNFIKSRFKENFDNIEYSNVTFQKNQQSTYYLLIILNELFNKYFSAIKYSLRLLCYKPYRYKDLDYLSNISDDLFKINDKGNIIIKHMNLIPNTYMCYKDTKKIESTNYIKICEMSKIYDIYFK